MDHQCDQSKTFQLLITSGTPTLLLEKNSSRRILREWSSYSPQLLSDRPRRNLSGVRKSWVFSGLSTKSSLFFESLVHSKRFSTSNSWSSYTLSKRKKKEKRKSETEKSSANDFDLFSIEKKDHIHPWKGRANARPPSTSDPSARDSYRPEACTRVPRSFLRPRASFSHSRPRWTLWWTASERWLRASSPTPTGSSLPWLGSPRLSMRKIDSVKTPPHISWLKNVENLPMSWWDCCWGPVCMAVWGGLCPEPLLLAELSLDNIDTVSENALSLSGLSVRIAENEYSTLVGRRILRRKK